MRRPRPQLQCGSPRPVQLARADRQLHSSAREGDLPGRSRRQLQSPLQRGDPLGRRRRQSRRAASEPKSPTKPTKAEPTKSGPESPTEPTKSEPTESGPESPADGDGARQRLGVGHGVGAGVDGVGQGVADEAGEVETGAADEAVGVGAASGT